MKQYARAFMLAVGLCLPFASMALDMTIVNKSATTAVFAFSYADADSGKWVVDGWYNVAGSSKGTLTLNTNNDVYYLYAELENGKSINDPHGVALAIEDKPFYYVQEDGLPSATRTVNFVRASANQGKAIININ